MINEFQEGIEAVMSDERLAQENLLNMNIGRGNNLFEIIKEIKKFGNAVPTGYPELDMKLNGGLRLGVTFIAAPPGTGKTTLCLQLAESFSVGGIQTLYLTNDMTQIELVSKMLSRHSYIIARENGFTGDQIMTLSDEVENSEIFQAACRNYMNRAQMLRIEGIEFGGNIEQIQLLAQLYGAYGVGKQKVMIIDYLQNVEVNGAIGAKEQMDKLVKELKMISDQYKLAIIAISSISRMNYNIPLTMSSLKESGNLEYGADLVVALQHKGVGNKDFNLQEVKRKPLWDMELTILKNRFGRSDISVPLKFYPKFNLFTFEDLAPELPSSSKKSKMKRTQILI